MKKLLFILPALLGALLSLYAGEDHFSDLNDAQKLALSEAYQAVGEHFVQTGETKRGDSYERTAEILRGQIQDLSAAAKAQTTMNTAMKGTPKVKAVTENDKKAVGYYFRKLVRAVLSENSSKVMGILDNPFALEGYLSGVPQDKIEADLEIIFDSYDLTAYDSYDLYQMDSISYAYEKNTEDVIVLTIPATTSGEGTSLEMVIFWDSVQEFYFKRVDQGWKLFAIF